MIKDLSNENIIHIEKDGIEYIQFKKLLEFKNVIHCFTLRSNGKLDFDRHKRKKAKDSYNTIKELLGFNRIIKTKQKHTDIIKIIESGEEKFRQADGLITSKKGMSISTVAADCISIILFDKGKNVIANIHSGWRGTEKGIIRKAVKMMEEKYNCDPRNIIACICPSIRMCHFEVSEDVKQLFENKYGYMDNIDEIIKKGDKEGKFFIDTVEINKQILLESGLKNDNIIDSNICTVCNRELFYSYRGDNHVTGRNTAIIELI